MESISRLKDLRQRCSAREFSACRPPGHPHPARGMHPSPHTHAGKQRFGSHRRGWDLTNPRSPTRMQSCSTGAAPVRVPSRAGATARHPHGETCQRWVVRAGHSVRGGVVCDGGLSGLCYVTWRKASTTAQLCSRQRLVRAPLQGRQSRRRGLRRLGRGGRGQGSPGADRSLGSGAASRAARRRRGRGAASVLLLRPHLQRPGTGAARQDLQGRVPAEAQGL